MDLFLAYLLYKRRNCTEQQQQTDYIETALAVIVLIVGIAKLAAFCKGRPF